MKDKVKEKRIHMKPLIIVFLILAVICFLYYVIAVSYAGMQSAFLSFWLLATIGFAGLAGLCIWHEKRQIFDAVPKGLKIGILALLLVGVLIFATMEALIISKMSAKPEGEVEYLIVLGAQVRGTTVTKSLARRLQAACAYLEEHPETKVVCSGGQGTGEDISEAEAMKRYLKGAGIPETQIILEDTSTSTYENLRNSSELIGDSKASIAVVTNNFHVYRGMHLARYVGFEDVQGLAGECDEILQLNYMVREGLALFKELVVH